MLEGEVLLVMKMRNDRKHLDKYLGEWVAFNRDEVVAHGIDPVKVSENAKKVCKRPVLFLVPENLDLEFFDECKRITTQIYDSFLVH